MASTFRDADRESWARIPETCPDVAKLFERTERDMLESVKRDLDALHDAEQTYRIRLRQELTNVCAELIETEHERDSYKERVEELEAEVEELRAARE